MSKAGCRRSGIIFSAIVVISLGYSAARADDREQRDFSIFVNGKEAGVSRMLLVQRDDGTSYMSGSVDVKFRGVIVDFSLKVETQEWWKQGRLIALKTTSQENNKRTEVVGSLDNNGQLRVRVNNRDNVVNPEVWTDSYWKLADSRFHNKKLPILEVETGKDFVGELRYNGPKRLKVGNDFLDCYHFTVSTNTGPVEVWYDRYHRLVRRESTESGHKIIVQLNGIRR